MKLHLDLPATWTRQAGPGAGDETALVPDADARVEWGALTLLPDEQRAWVDATLRRDTPVGAHVEVARNITTETATGWPVRLVEATVHLVAGGPAVEWRTAAFYAFLEHAGVAIVRATDEGRYRAHAEALRALLLGASPDWTAEPACLAELWDVTTRAPRRHAEPAAALRRAFDQEAATALTDAVARARLATLDAELATAPTAAGHAARGELLHAVGERDPAIAAYRAALALDADHTGARRGLALALAAAGRERDAIEAWEAIAAADPGDSDALYNAGIAHTRLGDHAAALGSWQRAFERAPRDYWIARKLVQGCYALERFAEAAAARASLLEIWRTTSDPAVRMQDEFVFDQFAVGDVTVHASETLRPRDPASHALCTFRVVAHAGPALQVAIETSDYAKARGVPYVISVLDGTRYRAVGTSDQLPPYPELEKSVVALIAEALAARARTP